MLGNQAWGTGGAMACMSRCSRRRVLWCHALKLQPEGSAVLACCHKRLGFQHILGPVNLCLEAGGLYRKLQPEVTSDCLGIF